MKAYEAQTQKIENNYFIRERNKPKEPEEGVIYAVADVCVPFLTYYNNGKCNQCCKTPYDYNFFFCEGYDQSLFRDDRKHVHHYLHNDKEEEYPCRTVTLSTNSNYGHRPNIDTMLPMGKKKMIHTFYRNSGTSPCINANGYENVTLNPTWSFRYNAAFGYTYSPPKQ